MLSHTTLEHDTVHVIMPCIQQYYYMYTASYYTTDVGRIDTFGIAVSLTTSRL